MAIVRTMGWRPSAPDLRDIMYKAPDRVSATLPDYVDLSNPTLPHPFEPPNGQGELGSCGPQSAAKDIIYSSLKHEQHKEALVPSILFIYYNTRAIMGTLESDSGVDNRSLMKSLNKFGWCDESLWPYDDNASRSGRFLQRPPDAAYQQASNRKITGYARVEQDPRTMMACLANGDPFIFGFNVYSSMLTSEVDRTGIIPSPRFMDRRRGGHDVLIVGYNNSSVPVMDIPAGHFKFLNSWTREWGFNGYGYIPISYACDPMLADDFWTATGTGVISDPIVQPKPEDKPESPTDHKTYDIPGFGRFRIPAWPGDDVSFKKSG